MRFLILGKYRDWKAINIAYSLLVVSFVSCRAFGGFKTVINNCKHDKTTPQPSKKGKFSSKKYV